jgi:hypothetical protein
MRSIAETQAAEVTPLRPRDSAVAVAARVVALEAVVAELVEIVTGLVESLSEFAGQGGKEAA